MVLRFCRSKLLNGLVQELRLNIDKIVFCTDSKVVLGYIQNESRRFYVYVANRIKIIRSISDPFQWRYVDTSVNPAHSATRCRPAKQLIMSSWFDGPDFLRHPPSPLVNCPKILQSMTLKFDQKLLHFL